MANVGGRTRIVNGAIAVRGVPAESTTLNVTVLLPVAVGVPASAPPALSVRPLGNVPVRTLHVYGSVPPVAATCTL